MHSQRKTMTRRSLLRRAGVASAAAASAPYVLTSAALGADGRPPASDRIVAGGIGIRSRGRHDLTWMMGEKDVQFVAICDVQRSSREMVKQIVDKHNGNTDCKMYRDLREFLPARPDIDVILMATGERWHAMGAMTVMKSGKDIYCEKPGSMTIAEGQGLVEAGKRYGRIFQTGTQRRSEANFVFCEEMARNGRLGKLTELHAHIAPWDPILKHDWRPAEPEPPRDEVDWDLWLGPCPWRPYNKAYVSGGWRGYLRFPHRRRRRMGQPYPLPVPGRHARGHVPARSSSTPATTTAKGSWPSIRTAFGWCSAEGLARLVRREVRRHGRLGVRGGRLRPAGRFRPADAGRLQDGRRRLRRRDAPPAEPRPRPAGLRQDAAVRPSPTRRSAIGRCPSSTARTSASGSGAT